MISMCKTDIWIANLVTRGNKIIEQLILEQRIIKNTILLPRINLFIRKGDTKDELKTEIAYGWAFGVLCYHGILIRLKENFVEQVASHASWFLVFFVKKCS